MIELALAAQILVWLALVGFFLASGRPSIFHPVTTYLVFHFLVFVLRPVLVYYFGFDANWNYMEFKPTDSEFVKTLAVSSVGLLCFSLSCMAVGKSRPVFQTGVAPAFNAAERKAFICCCVLLVPVIAFSIFATRNGIAGERVNGIYIMTNSTGYLNDAQHMIMPLLCLCLVATRFHWVNVIPILLYLAYRTWFGWSRWTILLFLLMFVLVYAWYHQKKWLSLWCVLLALPILAVFNVLGHNRDALKHMIDGERVQLTPSGVGMSQAEKLRSQLDTQDYANFDYLSYVVSVVPDRTGRYTYGGQYLQLFTEPIPRILWKGKPVGAPVRTINIGAFGNFVGLTVSLCGDGWISGGWLGLMITLSVVGAALGYAHERFWQNSGTNALALSYLVGIAMVPQWYRDGGISIAKFLFWNLSPLILWQGIAWLFGPRQVPVSSTLVPRGTALRFVQADSAAGRDVGPPNPSPSAPPTTVSA